MQHVLRAPLRLVAGAGMAFTLLFSVACDDDDPVEPPVATELSINAGNNQTIAVSTASSPLIVTVLDQDDDEMQGVSVAWVVATGGGTLSAATSTTNADGKAQIVYTSGATVGAVTVRATVAGLTPVTFLITVQ